MPSRKKLMTYEEILAKSPKFFIFQNGVIFREATPEATEEALTHNRRVNGYTVDFLQKNGLTVRLLCDTAPEIPQDFCLYLRDLTPEGFELIRAAHEKWLRRFDRNRDADPSDMRIMEKELAALRAKNLK
jgi:hypothetical protein